MVRSRVVSFAVPFPKRLTGADHPRSKGLSSPAGSGPVITNYTPLTLGLPLFVLVSRLSPKPLSTAESFVRSGLAACTAVRRSLLVAAPSNTLLLTACLGDNIKSVRVIASVSLGLYSTTYPVYLSTAQKSQRRGCSSKANSQRMVEAESVCTRR
jgi:hypothetical protein